MQEQRLAVLETTSGTTQQEPNPQGDVSTERPGTSQPPAGANGVNTSVVSTTKGNANDMPFITSPKEPWWKQTQHTTNTNYK